jgi:hypothetical protein
MLKNRAMRLNRLSILVLAGAGLCTAPAYAQFVGGGSLLNLNRSHVPANNQTRKPGPTPPPALPGAQSNPANVAPPSQPPSDMSPTDALFDAINRGDIAAARDAISRGADLRGHNVLDMTPLDLSIDLARNDITFLLLSMRGVGAAPPAATAAATPNKPGAGRLAAHETRTVAQGRSVRAKPETVAVRAAAPAKQAAPAREYAGRSDPGTPSPQAGFLGFGGTAQP